MNVRARRQDGSTRHVALGDVLEIKNDIVHPRDKPHGIAMFVGLEHIERDTGIRIGSKTLDLSEMTGRRARFEEGDIVYGYLRPYLNKVWIAEFDGLCSVDQYVLRVKPGFDRNYVAHYLRSAEFLKTAPVDLAPGQLPRIRSGEITATPIPLPPLDEQRRIAAILDKADSLRNKRKQVIALLDSLTQSIFLEMFGDPASNPKGFPQYRIGDLLESASYGTSSKAGTEGDYPILRMGNVTSNGHIDTSELKYINLSVKEIEKYTVRKGDILFNRTNSADLVGKTAVFDLDEPFAFAGYLVRARARKGIVPEYISGYLNSAHGKATLRNMAKSIVGMANINAKEMQSIPILLPGEKTQHEFKQKLKHIARRKAQMLAANGQIDSLFASLQHRAFAGEL